MDVEALSRIAVTRKGRYLERYPIAARADWEMLKLAEEVGEVSEAHDLMLDAPGDEGRLRGFAEEAADAAGFLAIVADAAGVPLDAAPADPLPADRAWRRFLTDVGVAVKAYNRATGQSRPTGRPPVELRAELADALSTALGSLDAAAAAHGIDLGAAFDAKWGLEDLPLSVAGQHAGPRP